MYVDNDMILKPILAAIISQFASGTVMSSEIRKIGGVLCCRINYYSSDEAPGFVLGEHNGVKVSAYLVGLKRTERGVCAIFKITAPISVDICEDASHPLKNKF